MNKQRKMTRLAVSLLSALAELKKLRQQTFQDKLRPIELKCKELLRTSKKLGNAMDMNLTITSQKMLTKTGSDLSDLAYNICSFREVSDTMLQPVPSLKDVCDELKHLRREFGDIEIDYAGKSISVITDHIELEGIHLGRFEIKLYIDKFKTMHSSERPYRVFALEPNPAACNCDVTHPHVSDQRVCEGEGVYAVTSALMQARIADFFNIMISILETYNSDSPFIALSDWEGRGCNDCGCIVPDGELFYCDHCDGNFCDNCRTYCRICDENICYGCAFECPECGEFVCNNCRSLCKKCNNTYCKDCLTDGFCQSCLDEEKDNNENTKQHICAVQPHCMG